MPTLTSITFSKGSKLSSLEFNAFIWDNLIEFTIPESISTLSGVAFCSNTNMQNIHVDPMNQYLWDDTKAVYNKDKTIIYYCASACGESYTILDTVTMINQGCFIHSNLKNIIIPPSVTSIGSYAFYYCRKLKQINLPPNITVLRKLAFHGSGLTSIEIPNKVTILEVGVFQNCNNLINIVLPENISDIGGNALPSIPNLNLTLSSKSLYIDKQLIIYANNNKTISQFLGQDYDIVIPYAVTRIRMQAFLNKIKISSVTFDGDSQLQYIEYGAFSGCTNLSKFSFGNHIIEIGTSAFENAILNSEIAFPATLTKISNTAFKNCKKIPSISFSSSSSLQILDSAFENCISITSIIFITNTETTLGSSCFSNLKLFKTSE
ncbi:hypothetical protein TVAG_052480 [Trichomonas vaginalis G3]|uniref:Surface antigen BspA-like n=1 Tax=Trichomonas vaginalis (strain ATCC PRA-98 / G3) TaxID=412133 RepID=A2FGH6_TRIV3|nr:ribonuclease inhibitor domain-containing protein [Trichomonas vaginalis G3]EAX95990.1 hypothetical protein TVAG_052480 [Trichomonas vaginalis G3]KAI5537682.1 ribonuclease inhibitor domain-containing protein [Trichomonas vaginalis G3]|eukprot:XP_001308920.1 hypothetical protein [Trichomonas vaginalis G3]